MPAQKNSWHSLLFYIIKTTIFLIPVVILSSFLLALLLDSNLIPKFGCSGLGCLGLLPLVIIAYIVLLVVLPLLISLITKSLGVSKVKQRKLVLLPILFVVASLVLDKGFELIQENQQIESYLEKKFRSMYYNYPKSTHTDSTAATYTNETLGYTLLYPTNSALKQFTCDEDDYELFALEDDVVQPCAPRGSYYDIEVRVEDNNSATASYYAEKYHNTEISVETKSITIDGEEGIRAHLESTTPSPGPSKWQEVRLSHNNQTYVLILGNMEYDKTFEQILESFEFTF